MKRRNLSACVAELTHPPLLSSGEWLWLDSDSESDSGVHFLCSGLHEVFLYCLTLSMRSSSSGSRSSCSRWSKPQLNPKRDPLPCTKHRHSFRTSFAIVWAWPTLLLMVMMLLLLRPASTDWCHYPFSVLSTKVVAEAGRHKSVCGTAPLDNKQLEIEEVAVL